MHPWKDYFPKVKEFPHKSIPLLMTLKCWLRYDYLKSKLNKVRLNSEEINLTKIQEEEPLEDGKLSVCVAVHVSIFKFHFSN